MTGLRLGKRSAIPLQKPKKNKGGLALSRICRQAEHIGAGQFRFLKGSFNPIYRGVEQLGLDIVGGEREHLTDRFLRRSRPAQHQAHGGAFELKADDSLHSFFQISVDQSEQAGRFTEASGLLHNIVDNGVLRRAKIVRNDRIPDLGTKGGGLA